MPVTSRFDGRLLWLEFTGELNHSLVDDITLVTLQIEDKLNPMPNRIVDLSRVTNITIQFSSMFTIAQRRQARKFPNAFRSALVAPQQVHLGFARMYQTILNHPQIEVQVFESLPPALAWLDELKIEGLEQAARALE